MRETEMKVLFSKT